jgi:hypothetical protein
MFFRNHTSTHAPFGPLTRYPYVSIAAAYAAGSPGAAPSIVSNL